MRILFFLLFFASYAFAEAPREIMVSASSWAWAPPDTARITLEVEATGKTAVEAQDALANKIKSLSSTLKSTSASIADRGYALQGPSKDSKLSKSGVVRAINYLGVDTSDLSSVGKIIDSMLSAGATSVTDVIYSVKKDEGLKRAAAEDATRLASEKAAVLAKSLGVQLGPVLSASVTELPQGRVRRQRRERGENVDAYSDQEYYVTVTLKYGVK